MSRSRFAVLVCVWMLAALVSSAAAQYVAVAVKRPAAPPSDLALTATTLYSADGPVFGDRFGTAIGHLPDLDGDGLVELVVGAPNRQPFSWGTKGHVFVLSGADGSVLRVHGGWNKGDRLGHSVAALPDLDGDGVPEYGSGAIWAVNVDPDGTEAPGRVALWSGATGLSVPAIGGTDKWECFGAALGSLGDLDHDGVGDLLITARFGGSPDGDALLASGHVRFVSGTTGATLAQVEGSHPGDWLGWTAVVLPDLNADGMPDVAAASWSWPSPQARGQVLILSGADGAVLAQFQGLADGERFGWALAALPDIDGDGLAELAIGAPFAGAERGRVAVVSPAQGQVLFSLPGLALGEQFGSALAPIGDRTGDGVTELAIGAPKCGMSAGRVLIVSPDDGKLLGIASGGLMGGRFGDALHAVPDLTGDGHDELAVGAPTAPAGIANGQVVVLSFH